MFLASWSVAAHAATIDNVTSGAGPFNTLQEAVLNYAPNDVLVVTSGTITDTLQVTVDENLTIEGAGSGITILTNSGTGIDEVIDVTNGANLTLRDLSITSAATNRRAISGTAGSGSDFLFENVIFDTRYTGQDGGNLYLQNFDSVTMTNGSFLGKGTQTLASDGGAMYLIGLGASSVVTLTDVSFIDSRVADLGGAIYVSNAAVTCDGCVFDSPLADSGAAIYALGSGSVTAKRSRFCGGSVSGAGGAIYSATTTTLKNNIFGQNTAGAGGAVYPTGSGTTWNITNNHFIGNGGGAAIETALGNTLEPLVNNNLFLSNTGNGVNVADAGSLIRYNWFYGDGAIGGTQTNNRFDLADPMLVEQTGSCLTADLWPSPYVSRLVDGNGATPNGGDPAITDLDGSPSDIGAFGGPDADPTLIIHDDADSDNFTYLHDCEDDNGANYPGNAEICDHLDNDCDADVDDDDADVDEDEASTWYKDCDHDGQGTILDSEVACFEPPPEGGCDWVSDDIAMELAAADCDDLDDDIFLGADEHCTPGDQNCDGLNDEGAVEAVTYYVDDDEDGYGDPALTQTSCTVAPPGTSENGDDCDDSNPDFHPGADDPCPDGLDQDCGGADGDPTNSDPWYLDDDEDGFGDLYLDPVYSCESLAPAYTPAADALDCDDANGDIYPGAQEVCNQADDDCNNAVDDVGEPVTWFNDSDGDGFGDDVFPVLDDCPPDDGWVLTGDDCDDGERAINPSADELCNEGIDDDCDGRIDDEDNSVVDASDLWLDFDQDGFGACDPADPKCRPEKVCLMTTTDTWAENSDDCDDTNPAANPAQEERAGNEIDENCDGSLGPPARLKQYEGGGCNCATPALPVPALTLLGMVPLVLIRRRR